MNFSFDSKNVYNISGDDDHKLYDRADKTVMDSKCGIKSPFTITSSEERIYIRFKTGVSNSRYRGFIAGYVLYEPSNVKALLHTIYFYFINGFAAA